MASSKHRGTGFSLVEVLVSIVVLSVGLLGTVRMLLASVRTSNEAATFTAAVNLVRELSEKARMNKGVATSNSTANAYLVEQRAVGVGSDAGSAGRTCMASGAACDAAQLAAWDMREWLQRIAKALPEARVSVCFDETPWSDAAAEYAWPCSHTGRNVVVKLGWTPRGTAETTRLSAPRLVMQLVPGHVDHVHGGT
ncbi:type IV pilus modification protein PilV [Variovorax sp. EL159]|uniref:type IV pilus modification protein PilV n=1 Tax=Variovorax sp. EL159 TaxID=1566270 RepID=UPI00087F1EC1|nr:type IV pilus modification protein PilV [Variovorax sp. EL159]SCX74277.1 type IV pilus assembly protein PilV [Variovorax sp. EL159]